MTTEQEKKQSAVEVDSTKEIPTLKGGGTLRKRLLTFILPTVLIPLVAASIVGQNQAVNKAKNQIINELETDTLLAGKTVNSFFRESLKTTSLIAAEPELISLMKAGGKQAQELGLDRQDIDEIEEQFASEKLLSLNERVNEYLLRIVQKSDIVEVFGTEKNGFNVAYSNPTSDFVQRDETWWQEAKNRGIFFEDPEFDDSAQANVIAFSEAVRDPVTQEFLGVIKTGISLAAFENNLDNYLFEEQKKDYNFQIINVATGKVFDSIEANRDLSEQQVKNIEEIAMLGEENTLAVAQILDRVADKSLSLSEAENQITQKSGVSEISFRQEQGFNGDSIAGSLKYQNKIYSFATIPNTDLVAIGTVDYSLITAEGRQILIIFALLTVALGLTATAATIFLARQISHPIQSLSVTAQQVAAGNLDLEAEVEGTLETKNLAYNFNNLVSQIKESLADQQQIAEEQRQGKEKLEQAIFTLIDEISEATDGDLTVRANLDSLELSTVADLFNAIIDNLQDIAVEAKQSSSIVGSSLKENEQAIRILAETAVAEAKETRDTLMSVEEMSRSIQAVAKNAKDAEQITDDTYNAVLQSTENMNLTVSSILALRDTVGETADKMKRLGESSKQISQAVSLIEEISLKTNVLAINASAEAERAGEYGQGFSVVAEQVGSLAEQSAAATKEIAKVVAAIQAETREISQAMKSGTAQVTDSTELVRSTKNSLGQVLKRSREITQLMSSISQTTVSQATTSQDVTSLMQRIAELSETTSQSSEQVARSIGETAQVAQKLESAVAQFKVSS